MKSLAVAEMMSTHPITCSGEDDIITAARILTKYNISSLVVVDHDEVKGIITVDDIVRRVVAKNENSQLKKVKDIMTKDIISVEPNATVGEVIDTLNSNSISQVPVMKHKKLHGFVTLKDLLRLQPAFFELFKSRFEDEEKERRSFIKNYGDVSDDDLE